MNSSVSVNPHGELCRKIEDILDIQKAKGNFTVRQVAFHVPSESGSTGSTNLAKSLDTGLSETKSGNHKKSLKSRRLKSPPDVLSWPSDSDITVLRMKLCMTSSDLNPKENGSRVIPGDGLHQPDSSSMINLATLILQSQHSSKHSIVEELLLPLTSWVHGQNQELVNKEPVVEQSTHDYPKVVSNEFKRYESSCSHRDYDDLSSTKSGIFSLNKNTKSKVAKFLRLYFCPCCTCLYKLERMRQEPSVCFTKCKEPTNI